MTAPLIVFDKDGVSNDVWSDDLMAVVRISPGTLTTGDTPGQWYVLGRHAILVAFDTQEHSREYLDHVTTRPLGPLYRIVDDANEPTKLASPYPKGPVIWVRVEGGYRLYYADDRTPIELRIVKTLHDAYNVSVAEGFRAWRWAPEVCAPRDMTDHFNPGRTR